MTPGCLRLFSASVKGPPVQVEAFAALLGPERTRESDATTVRQQLLSSPSPGVAIVTVTVTVAIVKSKDLRIPPMRR